MKFVTQTLCYAFIIGSIVSATDVPEKPKVQPGIASDTKIQSKRGADDSRQINANLNSGVGPSQATITNLPQFYGGHFAQLGNFFASAAAPQRPFEIKLTNLSIHAHHNSLSQNLTVKDSAIDTWIDLRETVDQFYMHSEVRLDLGNGKFEFQFMNRTIDVCRLFRDRKYEPLAQIIHKTILRHCDCATRCPIQKIYYVKAPQSNHAGVQFPTANALKIAYVPAPQPHHTVTYATAPTNSKVAVASQPHYQNYQLAYSNQPISYSSAAIAVPYNNNNHHQQQLIQIPNGYQLAAFSHQPIQISQPYSYVTSAPNEAGKALLHAPSTAQTSNAYHQQPQTFTFPTYQQVAAPINVPTTAKFVAFPPYSPSQYKPINVPAHAPAQPSAGAASHGTHDGATSFASFSQQLNQRHHATPTAITPVKVLAQPHQQFYVTVPPPSAGYSSQKIAFQPITAAASSPQAYESPHNVNGVIHYGTHLYHPSIGKYGIGQVPPPPSPKIIYSH